jgi:hypothetical protein
MRGSGLVAAGRLRVRSRRTRNQAECRFVVIHFGSLDFHAVVSQDPESDPGRFDSFKKQLLAANRSGSLADLTSLVAREFPGRAHRLDDLFREEQRRIIGIILQHRFADYERSFERLAVHDAEMLGRLGQLGYPIPKPLRAAASTYLDIHLLDEIGRLARGEAVSLEALEELCDRGRAWHYQPEREVLGRSLSKSLLAVLEEIKSDADLTEITARAERLVSAAALLHIAPELWQVQNRILSAYGELTDSKVMNATLHCAFEKLAAGLKVDQALLGWRP